MSRRTFGRAALAAGMVAAGAKAAPQAQDDLERQLAKPFDDAARPLVPAARKAVRDQAEARRKHPLPENSEPCTVYVPSPREAR